MHISLRKETPADYRQVEELTRDAFWGCMDHPTCDGEHLLVHKLRGLPCFVPELDFVAEAEGRIVGHVIYSLAKVVTPEGQEIPVLNFGPLSVSPDCRRMGIGSALMRHSIREAAALGYRAIIFYGHPDYYPRFGFRRAGQYGIVSADGSSFDALMAMELHDGALEGITGRYFEDAVYAVDPEEMAEFDKGFPYREPVQLLLVEALTDRLPGLPWQVFVQHGVRYVAQLQRYSGRELLEWEGMDEGLLKQMNGILAQLGQPCKLLPSSYIFALTQMHVRNPVCSLMRSKAGISLYRVETEGERFVLKVFEKQEDTREIENYRLLSSLGIPTLPLLGCTQNAILMPEVSGGGAEIEGRVEDDLICSKECRSDIKDEFASPEGQSRSAEDEFASPEGQSRSAEDEFASLKGQSRSAEEEPASLETCGSGAEEGAAYLGSRSDAAGKGTACLKRQGGRDDYRLVTAKYRLGRADDLRNPQVARAIARWYRALHAKGREYLSGKAAPMYDESDSITLENMEKIAERTGTADNMLWQEIRRRYDQIRERIDALPRTLTYNDFYWTNLIVSIDEKSAFMFDYNLLGKGTAYGDIRNVTGSLSREAADAFLEEYGEQINEEEKRADAVIGHLVTLAGACEKDEFPSWAEESLEALRSGEILRSLGEWLQ